MFKYGLDKLTAGKVLAILNGELKAEINDEARKQI